MCNSQSIALCDWLARNNGTNQPETRCLSWVNRVGLAMSEVLLLYPS